MPTDDAHDDWAGETPLISRAVLSYEPSAEQRRAEAAEAQRDALLAVVRAAGDVGVFDKATMRLAAALDALSPELREMVDHSD